MSPDGILGLVLGCQGLLGLDGSMDGVEGQVDEQGLVGMCSDVPSDHVGCLGAEPVGEMFTLGAVFELWVAIGREVTTTR